MKGVEKEGSEYKLMVYLGDDTVVARLCIESGIDLARVVCMLSYDSCAQALP